MSIRGIILVLRLVLLEGMEKFDWLTATHLYTRSRLPWVIIPREAEQYEAESPRK